MINRSRCCSYQRGGRALVADVDHEPLGAVVEQSSPPPAIGGFVFLIGCEQCNPSIEYKKLRMINRSRCCSYQRGGRALVADVDHEPLGAVVEQSTSSPAIRGFALLTGCEQCNPSIEYKELRMINRSRCCSYQRGGRALVADVDHEPLDAVVEQSTPPPAIGGFVLLIGCERYNV